MKHWVPIHTQRVAVWCALWSGGIIGKYFSKTLKVRQKQSTVSAIRAKSPITKSMILMWEPSDFSRTVQHATHRVQR